MSDLFGGSTQPKYLGPEERTAYAVSEANTLTQGFRQAFESAQGAKQKQDAVDNERAFAKKQKEDEHAATMNKLGPVVEAMKGAKTTEDMLKLSKAHPEWMMDPEIGPYFGQAMKSWLQSDEIASKSEAGLAMKAADADYRNRVNALRNDPSGDSVLDAGLFAQNFGKPITPEMAGQLTKAEQNLAEFRSKRDADSGLKPTKIVEGPKGNTVTLGERKSQSALGGLQADRRDAEKRNASPKEIGELNAAILKQHQTGKQEKLISLTQDRETAVSSGASEAVIAAHDTLIKQAQAAAEVNTKPHIEKIGDSNYIVHGNSLKEIDKLAPSERNRVGLLNKKISTLQGELARFPERKDSEKAPDSRTKQLQAAEEELGKFMEKADAPSEAPATGTPDTGQSFKRGRFNITPVPPE